jgi:plastocyanin
MVSAQSKVLRSRIGRAAMLIILAGLPASVGGYLMSGQIRAADIAVAQKGRMFHRGTPSIARGQTVTFVNDDGDVLPHVYVETEGFNVDSGKREPGSRTAVAFTERGTFRVLCGIHPKMTLVVQVN